MDAVGTSLQPAGRESDRVKLLVHGWYGAGNVGDELLLALLKMWAQAEGADVKVMSIAPKLTTAMHGCEAVDRHNLYSVALAMKDSDLFVLGGGGLLQAHDDFTVPALYDFHRPDIAGYVRPALMAKQFGLTTLAWAQGVGPLSSGDPEDIVSSLLRNLDFVSVRDRESLETLRMLGGGDNVVCAPDAVWAFPLSVSNPSVDRQRIRIGIVVRDWHEWSAFDWSSSLVEFLLHALDPERHELVWIPFQPYEVPGRSSSDLALIERLTGMVPAPFVQEVCKLHSPQEAVQAINDCDALVAMRLHAQIVGLKLGLPVMAVEYDKKMAATSELAGVLDHCRLTQVDFKQGLMGKIERWLKDVDGRSASASSETVMKLTNDAQRHRDVLRAAINAARKSPARRWDAKDGFDWVNAWSNFGGNISEDFHDIRDAWRLLKMAAKYQLDDMDERRAVLEKSQLYQDGVVRAVAESMKSIEEIAQQISAGVSNRNELEMTLASLAELVTHQAAEIGEKQRLFERYVDDFQQREREHQALLADEKKRFERYSDDFQQREREHQALLAGEQKRFERYSDEFQHREREHQALIVDQQERLERHVEDSQRRERECGVLTDQLLQHQAWLKSIRLEADGLKSKMQVLQHDLELRNNLLTQERQRNAALRGSTSWRVTQPLRSIKRFLWRLGPERDSMEMPLATHDPQLPVAVDPSRLNATHGFASDSKAPLPSQAPEIRDWRETSCRKVFFFTGVPYDDIGGGQRAAQLARVLLSRGERVHYVYAYRKWHEGVEVESEVCIPRLEHTFLGNSTVEDVLADAKPGDVAIFELPHIDFKSALDICSRCGVSSVFELIDAWDSSLGGDWFSEEVFQYFIDRSDKVVGTAKVLQGVLKSRGRADALYLPNAANESIFDAYRHYERPAELEPEKRVALYFGSLYGEWFDWEALDAAARHCPDTVFYLIGDPPVGLTVAENIRFLGPKNIDELPAFLRHADIALLPFKPGHISDAVSPIKIFEYLYMGVPVISNLLPEVVDYPNVSIATSVEEFARLCAAPARTGEDVDRFIMENSWGARVDALASPRFVVGKKVSAIVLIHNNRAIIERCLTSLLRHGEDFWAEVIVVDNDSCDGGAEYVEAHFPQVKLLRNNRNGCSSGRNLGVAHASGDYLAFFDSDQWLTNRGGIEEALQILEARPDIGAVGWAAGWFADGNDNFGGPIMDYMPARGTNVAEYQQYGVRTDIAYLGSGGLFLHRDIFHATGGFDEFYDPTCFEDTDFTLSIKATGRKIAYRDLQGVRHQPHQTTSASAGNESYQALFRRNANYFGKKWQANHPDYFFDAPPHP
ncbi:polysaccharide pyruvyl transferase family protein [Solilutibacter tolerans]|uniref:Polysaccharide pyruvyl transferase CsaB n=1 Tax=Solilutibacter tolerans TaxID=1604334 RepID=A0A1N6N7W3_9GAMM|nr:polysaccharide pyruvyl transferase family protein [Lysobacter tolerans]SIP88136.1 polysaccharide pyruvyl transferase CsaB [Lysobacter tolerans]